MDKHSVERDIRNDKEELKQLRRDIVYRPPAQQEALMPYYQLKQQDVQEKARRAAMQTMTLHVLSFIAALSWADALKSSMQRLLEGAQTAWRSQLVTAVGMTALAVSLASRWAVNA